MPLIRQIQKKKLEHDINIYQEFATATSKFYIIGIWLQQESLPLLDTP